MQIYLGLLEFGQLNGISSGCLTLERRREKMIMMDASSQGTWGFPSHCIYNLNLNVYSSNLIYEKFFSFYTNFGTLLFQCWLSIFLSLNNSLLMWIWLLPSEHVLLACLQAELICLKKDFFEKLLPVCLEMQWKRKKSCQNLRCESFN